MSATISLSQTDVFTALRSFLLGVLPSGVEVVDAQDNGVPMPAGAFVAMTLMGNKRLATNTITFDAGSSNPGSESILTPGEYTVQLDFYGAGSDANAAITQALFRSEYATDQFPSNIQPLYADDPMQMPLINGEQQYEERWRVQAVMEYLPVVTVPQDYATSLDVGLISVERTYKP